jgi:alanyl-tRNA synthetase
MATAKLYWDDPFAMTFETLGAALGSWEGRPSIVLPGTRFYPEAGGQLADTGTLTLGDAIVTVVDAQVTDDGVIHHLFDGPAPEPSLFGAATRVRGTVDRARRLDHMAHHTAQHMLSSALADVARAETVSSRLGAGSCTVDLDVPGLSDVTLARAEARVNAVVRDDVPIRAFFPTDEELKTLDLRRAPKVSTGIRVVDIEGFDLSPCGGTHCTRSGQVGVVRVAGVEKYKGKMRVSFHAAERALADMRAKDAVLGALMGEFTCGVADLSAAVAKMKADLREAREALGQSRATLATAVAEEALARHPPKGAGEETRIVIVREHDDVASLRVLAGRLASRPDVVAICAAPAEGGQDYAVVIQRGSASRFDCGAWLKQAAAAAGGRGGGRPERAEGRLPGATVNALTLRAD